MKSRQQNAEEQRREIYGAGRETDREREGKEGDLEKEVQSERRQDVKVEELRRGKSWRWRQDFEQGILRGEFSMVKRQHLDEEEENERRRRVKGG